MSQQIYPGNVVYVPRDNDPVNSPSHYISPTGLEVIDVIEGFGLNENFLLANVVKYILRHPLKGGVQDLKKAQWYLNRAIDSLERKRAKTEPCLEIPK